MLTEEEARERWCPHARAAFYPPHAEAVESAAAINRATPDPAPKFDAYRDNVQMATRCLGALCMAWRWAALPRTVMAAGLTEAERAVLAATRPTGYIEYRSDDEKPRPLPCHGYCGLAGKP